VIMHILNQYMADICKTCGLPQDLCACVELDKEEVKIIIRKIEELMPILLNERDLTRQLDITRLVNNYLELLNKIDNTKG